RASLACAPSGTWLSGLAAILLRSLARQRDDEEAAVVVRGHAVGVHGQRQNHLDLELAVADAALVVAALVRSPVRVARVLVAAAGDHQHVLEQRYVEVVFAHTGDLDLDEQSLRPLEHVGGRAPAGARGEGLLAIELPDAAEELLDVAAGRGIAIGDVTVA